MREDTEIRRLVSRIQWSFGKRRRCLETDLTRLSQEDPAAIREVIEAVILRLRRIRAWRLALAVSSFLAAFALVILVVAATGFDWLVAILLPWGFVVFYAPYHSLATRARRMLGDTGDVQVVRLVLWLYYADDPPASSRVLRRHLVDLLPRLRREHADLVAPEHRESLRSMLYSAPTRAMPHEQVIAVLKGLVQIGDRGSYGALEYLARYTHHPEIRDLARAGVRELERSLSPIPAPSPPTLVFERTPTENVRATCICEAVESVLNDGEAMNESDIDRIVSGIYWSIGERRQRVEAELKRLAVEDPAAILKVIDAVTARLRRLQFARKWMPIAGFLLVALIAASVRVWDLMLLNFPVFLLCILGPYHWLATRTRKMLEKTGDVHVIRLILWLYYENEKPGTSLMLREKIMQLLPRLRREHADLVPLGYRYDLRRILYIADQPFFAPPPEHVIAVLKGLVQLNDQGAYGAIEHVAAHATDLDIRRLAEAGLRELEANSPFKELPQAAVSEPARTSRQNTGRPGTRARRRSF